MRVQYVYCRDHEFIRGASHGALALSCYRLDAKLANEVGFDFSAETEKVRREMVRNCYELQNAVPVLISEGNEVCFAPQAASGWMTAKVITQSIHHLSTGESHLFDLSVSFKTSLKELMTGKTSIHKDRTLVDELARIHIKFGLELQFWPYLTPYESVCYMYGARTETLIDQAHAFFLKRQLDLTEVTWPHFPVY